MPRRQRAVLDVAPHRARREHRAPARRHLPDVAAALREREPGLAWAEPWAVPLVTSGLATTYYERYRVLSAENVLRFMILDPANPSSIYCCLRAARESARTVRGAITSEMYEDLNSAWLEMRDCDYATLEARGVVRVPRLGEDALAPVPRRHLRHDAARRGLPLHPPRHPPRARRQHRAHPRRQVPHAAAERRRRRRRRRLLPVGRAAALGVGLRVLPQDLQRRDHAAAGGRAADPARRHAALAARLHQLHPRDPGDAVRRGQPRARARGRRAARAAALRPHRRHHPARACTST